MQVSFANYWLQRNTNGKIYTAKANQPWAITLYQAQQVTTGKANSLIISQMELSSETSLLDVATLNMDQLAKKLLSLKISDETSHQDVNCGKKQLTGYANRFSYKLDEQTFYVYQYYFMQGRTLYLVSFQADNSKDVTAMAKSISSLTCK